MGFKLCLNAKIINGTCPLPCLISRGHTGYKRPILTQNRWGVPHKTRFHPPTAAPCPANHFAPLAQEQVVQTGVPSKGGIFFTGAFHGQNRSNMGEKNIAKPTGIRNLMASLSPHSPLIPLEKASMWVHLTQRHPPV